MADARRRRIAENEARFREINDRLRDGLRTLPVDGSPVEFICECGHAACAEHVALTLDEYERVRQDPLLFALLPGHQIEDTEDVVGETDRFLVVRKRPPTQPIAEATDPRAGRR